MSKSYKNEKEKELSIYRFRSTKPIRDYVYNNILDDLQRSKIDFINECYNNTNTQQSYYSVYNNQIRPMELFLEKDCMYFSAEECNDLLSSRFFMSSGSKNIIRLFLNKYKEWGVSKGLITINQGIFIDGDTVKPKKKILERRLMDKDEFKEFLNDIELKGGNSRLCIPYLLSRYGIMGNKLEFMQRLEYKDIDFENKRVNVYDSEGNSLGYYVVDNYFLRYVQKVRPSEFYDYLVVIKSNSNSSNKKVELESYNSLNNKSFVVSKALGIKRIPYSKVAMSYKLELLLKIRSYRKLSRIDFAKVLMYINKKHVEIHESAVNTLIEYYETLTKDKVIKKVNADEYVADEDSINVVNKICNDINFRIDLNSIPCIYEYKNHTILREELK